VVVRDDEDPVTDPGPPGCSHKRLLARERVPALPLDGQVGELIDPEERRTRNMLVEIGVAAGLDTFERVAAVDELVTDQ
jgi:hypothetical protein